MENFPCDGCECRGTSSCQKACFRLHKFLREDAECYTRVRTTELVLPAWKVIQILDQESITPTRLTWQELCDSQLGYWDIKNSKHLTDGEKEMLLRFHEDDLSYDQIAKMYKISRRTIVRLLRRVKRIRSD